MRGEKRFEVQFDSGLFEKNQRLFGLRQVLPKGLYRRILIVRGDGVEKVRMVVDKCRRRSHWPG